MRLARLIVLLLLSLDYSGGARAHQRSESYSRWQLGPQQLEMQFTVRALEATRLPRGRTAASPGQALADHLAGHVGLRGGDCRPVRSPRPLAARPGYLRVEAAWRCAESPSALVIDAFFDLAAEHVHFASIEASGGLLQHVMTGERRTVQLAPGAGKADAGPGGVFAAWFANGVRHIGSGPDHLVFIAALLLICRRARDVAWAVTGFTVGHSITLSLAVLGVLQPDVPAIEAVIGLTIALVAVERTARTLESALPLAAAGAGLLLLPTLVAGRLGAGLLAGLALFGFCYLLLSREHGGRGGFRLLITGLFGLVHGFGFAGAFMAGGIEGRTLLPALAGFNAGVEAGQLAVVGMLLALGRLLRRRPSLGAAVTETATAAICGLGVFWFLSRAMT